MSNLSSPIGETIHVTVHAKGDGQCPACDRAKAWLTERAIPFALMEHDTAARQDLYAALNLADIDNLLPVATTVPQVFIRVGVDGEELRIGGADALSWSGLESLFPRTGDTT